MIESSRSNIMQGVTIMLHAIAPLTLLPLTAQHSCSSPGTVHKLMQKISPAGTCVILLGKGI